MAGKPRCQSFGTRMMGSLGLQLDAQVHLGYEPGGFVYTLDAPLSALTKAIGPSRGCAWPLC